MKLMLRRPKYLAIACVATILCADSCGVSFTSGALSNGKSPCVLLPASALKRIVSRIYGRAQTLDGGSQCRWSVSLTTAGRVNRIRSGYIYLDLSTLQDFSENAHIASNLRPGLPELNSADGHSYVTVVYPPAPETWIRANGKAITLHVDFRPLLPRHDVLELEARLGALALRRLK
jgi:hypothetical protein